jgi:hypothetical protein
MQSTTFEDSSSLRSLFSKSETDNSATVLPPVQQVNQAGASSQALSGQMVSQALSGPDSDQFAPTSKQSVNDNTIPNDTVTKLDTPQNGGGITSLPRTKIIALFIAPTLVLILIMIAVWTLYRKGVITGCIRKTRKETETNTRSNLLAQQMMNDASLNSYYGYRLKSQASGSIPELSEWLESVHGSDDEKVIPFPNKDISPSILPTFSPDSASIITEPKPVLSTSTATEKYTLNPMNSIFHSESFNTSYQNTHILRPQDGNMWKLGGLKYSRKKSNTLLTPSPSEEKVGFMRSLWQAGPPKTPTGMSVDNEGVRSWWSRKSSYKQDPNINLDVFHVW